MRHPLLVSIAVTIGISATASAGRPDSARIVQSNVNETIGKRVEWRKDAEAEAEISRTVHALLRGTITAERAVQIALLNNRELQATFEEIGIANADLTEVGLLKNPVFQVSARFPDRPPSATNLEFGIVQDFLDLFMIPLRKKVAANELARAELKVGDAVLKLAAEVKTAFYTLQGKQMLFSRLGVLENTNAAALELTQRQHEAGNINDLELANQQSTYSQSKLDAARDAERAGETESADGHLGSANAMDRFG